MYRTPEESTTKRTYNVPDIALRLVANIGKKYGVRVVCIVYDLRAFTNSARQRQRTYIHGGGKKTIDVLISRNTSRISDRRNDMCIRACIHMTARYINASSATRERLVESHDYNNISSDVFGASRDRTNKMSHRV